MSSSLEDYAEIAISFGYLALFVTALPIAALFACVSSMAELRGDSWRLLNLYQRPFPKGVEDIGMWQHIFTLLAMVSVVTNAGLTVFTMDLLGHYRVAVQYWVFVLFQWVCFSLQVVVMFVIPDIPEAVRIQLRRTHFIVSKLIDKLADEDSSDALGALAPLEVQPYPIALSAAVNPSPSPPPASLVRHQSSRSVSPPPPRREPPAPSSALPPRPSPPPRPAAAAPDQAKRPPSLSRSSSSGSDDSPRPPSNNSFYRLV